MKSIAVFLILNVLLLSAFTGMAKIPHGTASFCKTKSSKDCSAHQKKSAGNDCGKGTCNAMLACGTCGFVVAPSVSLSPVMAHLNRQTARPFSIGKLSDYHSSGWIPPKA
jgi:hypothetical protein